MTPVSKHGTYIDIAPELPGAGRENVMFYPGAKPSGNCNFMARVHPVKGDKWYACAMVLGNCAAPCTELPDGKSFLIGSFVVDRDDPQSWMELSSDARHAAWAPDSGVFCMFEFRNGIAFDCNGLRWQNEWPAFWINSVEEMTGNSVTLLGEDLSRGDCDARLVVDLVTGAGELAVVAEMPVN